MMLDPKVAVGDLLTAVTILLAAAGLLAELRRERLLSRRTLADNVRRSAGLIVAKVDRRRRLSRSLFDEVQPIITAADVRLVKEQDVVKVRDSFWRELFLLRASIEKRAVEEQIEIAYADLYGFDPRIEELFSGLIERLRKIDALTFDALVIETQVDILSFRTKSPPFKSAALGNKLRLTCTRISNISWQLTDALSNAFGSEMRRLVAASDEEIEERSFTLILSDDVLPAVPTNLLAQMAPNKDKVVEEQVASGGNPVDESLRKEAREVPDSGPKEMGRGGWRHGESA